MISDKRIISMLEGAGFTRDSEFIPMAGAGSDRSFYRVKSCNCSAILITGDGHGADLSRWIDIQIFLELVGVDVPMLFAFDREVAAILVEDLGEMPPPKPEEYPFIVKKLANIQRSISERIDDCPTILEAPFDFIQFREESRYFADEYLLGYRKAQPVLIESLSPEFDDIAKELSNFPRFFCHRDFQSSNIALQGNRLRIIDFQSAKQGPLEYDLASLLWDSRIEINEGIRNRCIEDYIRIAPEKGLPIDVASFREKLYLTALSRTMQSLGAYCYLSSKKGKSAFLRLIPTAERHFLELLLKTKRLCLLVGLFKSN
ncbi:phosphotransferase [bacterium]|nr:phosphotransferase [bacterium]